MKKIVSLLLFCAFFIIPINHAIAFEATEGNENEWKAGVAQINITPDRSMWMAGFAARDKPSEGILHDIWAKALVFEDANGKQAVLITTDLLGFPKLISDRIRDRLKSGFDLSRAQIILNSSHTHSGPVLQDALMDIYPLDSDQLEKIEQYSRKLEDQIVELVHMAMQSMEPVNIYAENGVTRFQVNRRNNDASFLKQQSELNGPNDYAVPVIKVENNDGHIIAIAFGYACHPTTLSINDWSGDYAGFAQLELQKLYPDAVTLFFQGAGADQNPLPRGSVELAQQYGRDLATAVNKVLKEDMRQLPSGLSAVYSEIELDLSSPPSEKELADIAKESSGYSKRWAMRMLDKLKRGESLRTSYPYPVQVWKLGDQPIISMGGEVVVDYAIELKRIFGQDIFVLGYSNDVMGYIPSARILREGGYEGERSQIVYGQPSTWTANIEVMILYEIVKLAQQAGVSIP